MTSGELQLLYEYDALANHRMLDAARKLSPEMLTRDLGSSFPSVRDTLVHIMGAQLVWYQRWTGQEPAAMLRSEEFPTMEVLESRWAQIERDLLVYVSSLTDVQIRETREYRTIKGTLFRNPLWQSLQHLVNHNSYHRGQVTTMLRQMGAMPASTDLILFYREQDRAASA